MTTNDRLSDANLIDIEGAYPDPDIARLIAEVRTSRAAQPAADARGAAEAFVEANEGVLLQAKAKYHAQVRQEIVRQIAALIERDRAAAVAEAVKVLREVEWSNGGQRCPSCHGHEPGSSYCESMVRRVGQEGHDGCFPPCGHLLAEVEGQPPCRLAAEIKEQA